MRLCWRYIVCVCAVLAAGGVYASEELSPLHRIYVKYGYNVPMRVETLFDEVDTCYLVTPGGTTVDLLPEDKSGDKYELNEPGLLYACQVTVKNIDDNDIGIWELSYTSHPDIKGSQYYNITLEGSSITIIDEDDTESIEGSVNRGTEIESETVSSTEEDKHLEGFEVKTSTLTTLNYGATMNVNITITLSRKDYIEECFLRTPLGIVVKLDEAQLPGVQTFPTSTDFVSCRVVIGPMDESLLETWTLCGKHTEGQTVYERCQPGNIAWSMDNPADSWDSRIQPHFDHPVHFGSILSPVVWGTGVVSTCHVITPNGEDIAITAESDYPGLERIYSRDTTACGIAIGDIDDNFLGDWVLYGTYNSHFGFNVVSQPMTLFLYDEENPYNQAYNITTLTAENHVVNEGNIITVVVTGSGSRDACELITSTGHKYNESSITELKTANFVNNNNAECRLQLGPITKDMLGQWTLIGKFRRNGELFTELQQPINIIQEEESSETTIDENDTESTTVKEAENEGTEIESETVSSTEEDKHLEGFEVKKSTLTTLNYGATMNVNITITLSRKDYIEECFLRTPQGIVVKLDKAQLPGVQTFPTRTDFVSCRVVIGPMDESLLETWTLCGKHTEGQTVYERCQPGNIAWSMDNPADSWDSRIQPHFDHPVHFGSKLSPVVRGTGVINTCHVITPNGEDIAVTAESDYPGLERVVYSRDTTACGIAIGDIDNNFLGDWVLYGTYNSHFGFNVVSQPMTLFLYDEENPYNQAYNITTLTAENHVVNEGNIITVVVTGSGSRDACELITSTGNKYDENSITELKTANFVNNNNAACRLQLGPITKDMLGQWTLIGKFRRNGVLFTELQQPINIIQEDPANPVDDDRYQVSNLESEEIYTKFGEIHTITTATHKKMSTDSCHLRTPDNLQYILRDGFSLPGVEIVESSGISCGVRVHVVDEDAIGQWTLIARINNQGSRIEWRLPFTINVEEKVIAVPNVTTVAEGNDMYLRLASPTLFQDSCFLEGPVRNDAMRDENFVDTCGFIVSNITYADEGIWEIVYGDKVKFRAQINVTVTGRFLLHDINLVWTKNSALNETIGPEDTVFCRVMAPNGATVFEGFGRCNIVIDRVRTEHDGVWIMVFGKSGRVLTETYEFVVRVSEPEPKAEVSASVVEENSSLILSCRVASEYQVSACMFRNPSGLVLLPSQGVGEDRYTFYGTGVSGQTNGKVQECGLRITNIMTEDLGIWRCAVKTEEDTYFGFLSVICPIAMQDPAIAFTVISEPLLLPETILVSAVEGDVVAMSCSVQSAIRYCYFRAPNGTIFNVRPGTSEWFEYAGLGLDAGECNIRFPSLHASDSGQWSCHVGFNDMEEQEQRAQFVVIVEALMVADLIDEASSPALAVQALVHSQRPLEYCRFVRIDGMGFTTDQVPFGYEDQSILSSGYCAVRVNQPTILEMHPWTVVTKIEGQDAEIARVTQKNLDSLEDEDIGNISVPAMTSYYIAVWLCVIMISVSLFFIGVMMGPKKNREWTYNKSMVLRKSFSKRPKKPQPPKAVYTLPSA